MRYYSDTLKKFFDTEEQCLTAEQTDAQEKELAKVTKAKLAKAVDDADKAVDDAYKGFSEAKDKVAELQKEYDNKVDEILNPAKDKVLSALNARREAIVNFNKKYGPYTTVYTGDKATNELSKLISNFNKMFSLF